MTNTFKRLKKSETLHPSPFKLNRLLNRGSGILRVPLMLPELCVKCEPVCGGGAVVVMSEVYLMSLLPKSKSRIGL